MSLVDIKKTILSRYRAELVRPLDEISASNVSHQEKAQQINAAVNALHSKFVEGINANLSPKEKQNYRIILQYCLAVASLEYRHAVWPYEYMALSRRVGELWERFCSGAWEAPSRANVARIAPPEFSQVYNKLESEIIELAPKEKTVRVNEITNLIRGLIGEINMREDEVFTLDGVPHVIDFKSGFGSNEKGNMLRLVTVGRAYKLWDSRTKLLFLVRQEQNNNYLNVIKRANLWSVHCGDAAYDQIDLLTGSDMKSIRKQIIDFRSDLSQKFWGDVNSHLSDLGSYLSW